MKYFFYLFPLCFVLLFSCTEDENDACDTVICLNGGICENGECICPYGWSGENCEDSITHSKIVITKIELLVYNETKGDGSPWDANDDPDIYLGLWDNTSGDFDFTTQTMLNVSNPPLVYTLATPFTIDLTDDFWNISVNDDDVDTGDRDFIGAVNNFKFEDYIENYPDEITIVNHSCEFKFHVEYID